MERKLPVCLLMAAKGSKILNIKEKSCYKLAIEALFIQVHVCYSGSNGRATILLFKARAAHKY